MVVLGLLAGWVLPTDARAEEAGGAPPTCDPNASHVTVEFRGDFPAATQRGVVSDLAAALTPQRLGLCSGVSKSERTIASLSLTLTANSVVEIEVSDELTHKRVSRDISLPDPEDASAGLTVAVAADELLRATWAELALRKQEDEEANEGARQVPVSAEVPRESSDDEGNGSANTRPRLRFGFQGVADVFVTGSPFFGGDAFFGSRLGVIEWTLLFGPRFAHQTSSSPWGGATAKALSVELTLGWPVVSSGGFVLGPAASVQWMASRFTGQSSSPNVAGSEASGWALGLRGGLMTRYHWRRIFVGGTSQWGGALRGFEVTDGNQVVGGMRGLSWSSALCVGGAWP